MSPSGNLIAAGTNKGITRIFDVDKGKFFPRENQSIYMRCYMKKVNIVFLRSVFFYEDRFLPAISQD